VDGPGIESRWRRDIHHRTRPTLGPTLPPVKWVPGYIMQVKRPDCGFNHPTPTSADVKERVELYLYSPSGPSWTVDPGSNGSTYEKFYFTTLVGV